MRLTGVISAIIISMAPGITLASACNETGQTIVYVNGVFTSYDNAHNEMLQLEEAYKETGKLKTDVKFVTAYNTSHLAGTGDIAQSIAQAFNGSIGEYDLDTMLDQIHGELTTRKVLIVGHSQGAFYANQLYAYLIAHGVPKESVSVYAVATPATYVAGGGEYVNSSNDKVINEVRNEEVSANVSVRGASYDLAHGVVGSALRANVWIPKEPGWENDPNGGHAFGLYLDGVGQKIVSDIDAELSNLRAGSVSASDGCFEPPHYTLGRAIEGAMLAVSDPIAQVLASGEVALLRGLGLFASAGDSSVGVPDAPSQSNPPAGVLAVRADDALPTPPIASDGAAPHSAQAHTDAPTSPQPSVPAPEPPQPRPLPVAPAPAPQPSPTLLSISPGFGGGGGAAPAQAEALANEPDASDASGSGSDTSNVDDSNESDPGPSSLIVSSPQDGAAFATTSIVFAGTAQQGTDIAASLGEVSATTTADSSGAWSLALDVPEGDAMVQFSATTTSGQVVALSRSVTVDLTPPDAPDVSASACEASFAPFGCVVATTSIALQWEAAGANRYEVALNGAIVHETHATSSTVSLSPQATSSIEIVAYDAAGNAATSSALEIASFARPVIISEIGWGGTGTNRAAQWIEFKNLAPYTVDLSSFSLARSDGETIPLRGSISVTVGYPYAVLDNASMHNILGDSGEYTVDFPALPTDHAEQLTLLWNGEPVDQTPLEGACGGAWCAGSADAALGASAYGSSWMTPLSMERGADDSDGTQPASWHDTDSYGPFIAGHAPGVQIWGTPDGPNSANLPDFAVSCGVGFDVNHIAIDNAPYDPGTWGCNFLSRFITYYGERFNDVFQGDVGSSTMVSEQIAGQGLVGTTLFRNGPLVPPETPAGTHYFFAVFETSSVEDPALHQFDDYFEGATSTPPHGNYAVLRWTYQPQ